MYIMSIGCPRTLSSTVIHDWIETHGRKPTLVTSFDVNGVLMPIGKSTFDVRLKEEIRRARELGAIIMISSANNLESLQDYIRWMNIPLQWITFWGTGNGRSLYGQVENRWRVYHGVPVADLKEMERRMHKVYADIAQFAASESYTFCTGHPTWRDMLRPRNGHRLVLGAERELYGINIQVQREEGPEIIRSESGAIHVGGFVLDRLAKHCLVPTCVEIHEPNPGVVYINTMIARTHKWQHLAAVRDVLPHWIPVAHIGDSSNERGINNTGVQAFAPADTWFSRQPNVNVTAASHREDGRAAFQFLNTLLRRVAAA